LPEAFDGVDTDRHLTGERASVEEKTDMLSGEDIDVDRTVSGGEAGLAMTPPDPSRNGGLPPADRSSGTAHNEDPAERVDADEVDRSRH